jgi:hypothetical protein
MIRKSLGVSEIITEELNDRTDVWTVTQYKTESKSYEKA